MSIIYEALKKINRHLPSGTKKEVRNTWLWLIIGTILLGFIGSGFAVALLFSALTPPVQIIQKTPTPPPPAPVTLPQPQTVTTEPRSQPSSLSNLIPTRPKIADTLDLKGIMDSEGERIALINNEILRVGDYINGARVVRITKNAVELSLKDKIIILKIK